VTDLKGISKLNVFILILSLALITASLYYVSSSLIVSIPSKESLVSVVHLKHNAYFDLTTLGTWAASSAGYNVLLLWGLLGLTSVLFYHGVLATPALAASATVFGICSAIFGNDFLILGPLASLPFLYLIISIAKSAKISVLVLLTVAIVGLWLLLYSLSLPTLMVAILINFIVSQERMSRTTSIFLFLGCLLLFVLTAVSPELPWPDYPAFSRVTTLSDGPSALARPLVGIDLPFSTIDRSTLKSNYNFLILPIAALLLLIAAMSQLNPAAKKAWLCCAIGLSLVFFDLRLSENFAQIAPLQSLARLLPELNLIPLAPIVLSIILTGLILILMLTSLNSIIGAFFGLAFGLIVVTSGPHSVLDAQTENLPIEWNNSPSRFVTTFFSPQVLKNANSNWKKFRPKANSIKASSSNTAPVEVKLFIDRDKKTRWSPETGKQSGNEWLMLELSKPQKVIGIELQTGEFITDFPRGLRVKVADNCSDSELKTKVNFPEWQGHPKFTENGFPYFSAQRDVTVFFSEEIEASCFRIEQTGKSNSFDWSVAEFRLIIKE
jgi:hypothetical protein